MSAFRRMLMGLSPQERYIEGYANNGATVVFNLNGKRYETPRESNGYFKFSITENLGNEFVITSLDRFFCGDSDYSGYGVITYVNMSMIGSLKSCETMHKAFYNQVNLNAVTIDKSQITPFLKSFRDVFNECNAITKIDISMLDLTNVNGDGDSYDNLKSAFNTCSAMTELRLPDMPETLYTGSYCFRNLTSLTDLYVGKMNLKDFRIPDAPLNKASVERVLKAMSESTPIVYRQASFAKSVQTIINANSILTNYFNTAKNKGWEFTFV